MEKEVKFIFIDESITPEANLSSLTGVIIPITKIEKVVSDYYKIIKIIFDYLEKTTGEKQQFPPILHGKDFLRNSKENKEFNFSSITDEFRLIIFRKVIEIINDNDLFVIRLGYSNFKEIIETFAFDDKLHNLNWFNLSRTISRFYENALFIPVMEGIDSSIVHNFCGTIWSVNYIKNLHPEIAKSVYYNYPETNTFSSVFFTQSKYSEATQIVDIVSYLLQKVDYATITGKKSPFIDKLLEIVSHLKPGCVANSIIEMRYKKNME